MIKTYSELIRLNSFEERYKYLRLNGIVGEKTFGFDRYLNQILYNSREWKASRRDVIIRDNGCDLSCEGFEIYGRILVHHINSITTEDLFNRDPKIFDPENLISTSDNTHKAIHYGDESLLILAPIERSQNDTCLWKHQ